MDNNSQQISDDQELAKVLSANNKKNSNKELDLQFEESPLPTPVVSPSEAKSTNSTPGNNVAPSPTSNNPVSGVTPSVKVSTTPTVATPSASGQFNLDAIKKEALEQLRPLAPKLNLPAEEKFDTLLLIIRSTDDQSLLSAAHEAAKSIKDESRRAQALLDVIKEIDYFSSNNQLQTP